VSRDAGVTLTVPPRPVAVVGVGAVSVHGFDWRSSGVSALDGVTREPRPAEQLRASHPALGAFEVGPIAPTEDAGDARQRKLMTRAARLAAMATRKALDAAGFHERREEVGFYLGVGASGVAMDEVVPMLRASREGESFSLARFGREGLAACNPLFAFQTMNNFTLCHAAILTGVGGPNAALYSRGAATVQALEEALWAITEGACDRCLAGGADSALHPVTIDEFDREGLLARGLVPSEGAAVLALASQADAPIACVSCAARVSYRRRTMAEALGALREACGEQPDLVLVAPWGEPPRESLRTFAHSLNPGARVIDLSLHWGESLAATPALAWSAALDLIAANRARRVLVLSAGIDHEIGAVVFQ
jgi:3-oxoacyl-(acyl-carrier-protein) synthase